MSSSEIDLRRVRDLSPEVLDERGRMRILPAAFWAQTTAQERALFGHLNAVYSFPTLELVEFLRERIAGRRAIEIGAGHGVLADALQITGTDNRMQSRAKYRRIYALNGQPTITYGRNVVERDAYDAVRRYEPEVVIGCWVTHRWEPARHWAGGNEIGIDEADVIEHCSEYIMIGNEETHVAKAIWELDHTKIHPDFVYSRATNGSPDFIATWSGGRPGGRPGGSS